MNIVKSFFSIVSLLLGVALIWQWSLIHKQYSPNENQLESSDRVESYLHQHFGESAGVDSASLHRSSIGLFVESLRFSSAHDVEVSGHVWQNIRAADKDAILPGVVFPDAIGGVTLEERYTQSSSDYQVHGWYFEATLRQPFEYRDYPIDHKTVWIKVKPSGFNLGHVFVPDLDSYERTRLGDIFGVSPDIVLLGWEVNESFFDYTMVDYDTDFGLHNPEHHTLIPELTFNMVLNRNLLNAFMVNITLLLVTMFLLYILVVMITSDNELKEEFDITVGNAVSSCAGLFFAILLAHIHLREKFPSAGFVYLEFYYLLNYVFITLAALIIFGFYNKRQESQSLVYRDDAKWVKRLYWPVYFGTANLYTVMHFWN